MKIPEEQRREARTVTVSGSAEQLEIQLGHLCNNRCVFCTSGQLTEMGMARQIPTAPIFAALDAAAARGMRRVTFLGGEPTIQKSFIAALNHAIAAGFDDIVIFTNGVRTEHRRFLEEVTALGDHFTWRFSIQGGNEKAHDEVTLRPGSFRKIVKGLEILNELDQPITANMCVNELSYRSLPDYPELVTKHRVRQLHIDMFRPAHAGVRTDDYLRSILPRFSDMAPYIDTMLEKFERIDPDFDVNIGNYPYCVLPKWAHKIHHGGEMTFVHQADGSGELGAGWDKYAYQRSDMLHPEQCRGCVFLESCRGVPEKYIQFYGAEELRAISRSELLGHDAGQNFFVLEMEPLLEEVARANPYDGWQLVEIFRSTRDRRIELRYRGRSEIATAILTPKRGKYVPAPLAIAEGESWRLSVTAGECQAHELAALVTSLLATLRSDTPPNVAEETLTALQRGADVDQRRLSVRRYAEKLGRFDFRGWQMLPLRWSSDALELRCSVQDGSAAVVTARLAASFRRGAKPVVVEFDLPPNDRGTSRPVVEHLVGLLQA